MPDEIWKVMNNLEQSFSRISTVEFMLDELQEAVDEQNQMKIVDICYALNSFLPVYTLYETYNPYCLFFTSGINLDYYETLIMDCSC